MPPPEHLPATFILHASWEMIDMIVAKKEFKIHWLLQVQLFSALFPLLQLPTDFATHRVWRDCKWLQISHNPKRKLYFENPNWYKKTLLEAYRTSLTCTKGPDPSLYKPLLALHWSVSSQTDRQTHTHYTSLVHAHNDTKALILSILTFTLNRN